MIINKKLFHQVDDQEEERVPKSSSKKERKQKKAKETSDDKYKGYEILLDIEDDFNYSPPKGLSFYAFDAPVLILQICSKFTTFFCHIFCLSW